MSAFGTILNHHTVRFERVFPISIERLWDYLTTAEGLRNWLAEGTIGPDRVELRFANNGSIIRGAVTTWDPPHVVEFEWSGGPTQPQGSRVRFELTALAEGSRLVLTHSHVDPSAGPDFAAGWHHHLDSLTEVTQETQPASARPNWDELRQHYASR